MNENEKKWYQRPELWAGAGFGLLALYHLYWLLRYALYGGAVMTKLPMVLAILMHLLNAGAFGFLAYCLLTKRRDLLSKALLVMAGVQAVWFLYGFYTGAYEVESWGYYSGWQTKFNLLFVLPGLAGLIGWAGAWLFSEMQLNGKYEKYQDQAEELWFFPAVLVLADLVLTFLVYVLIILFTSGTWYSGLSSRSIVITLIQAGALGLTMQWVFWPEGRPRQEAAADDVDLRELPDGYCGIMKLIFLSLLTLGIYAMIWVHRTTRFLNQRIWPKMEHPVRHVLLCAIVPFYLIWWLCKNDAARDPDQSPAHQVAGCLFVPFYFTYWLYKNARRTDALARSRGMESNIAILCLVLGIFAPVVSMVVLQDRLNAILLPADYPAVSREAPVVPTAPAAPVGDNPDDLPEF